MALSRETWRGSRRLRNWLKLLSMPHAKQTIAINKVPYRDAPLQEPLVSKTAPKRIKKAAIRPRRLRCSRPINTAINNVNTASRFNSSETEPAESRLGPCTTQSGPTIPPRAVSPSKDGKSRR